MRKIKTEAIVAGVLCLTTALVAQQPTASANWSRWGFLVGEWVGEGSGGPGQGTGGFSFMLDLQGKILVRKNWAEYPASKDRPAYSHSDLMVIYREQETNRERAFYFDNEGHVIHYVIEFSKDGKKVEFLSDAKTSMPRYRLTYAKKDENTVSIKFEIAPAGKPDVFATYIEASAHRKSP